LSAGLLDQLAPERVAEFKTKLPDWLAEHAAAALHRIEQTGELDDATRSPLLGALRDLSAAVGPTDASGQTTEANADGRAPV
jgi:hypothetical protein